MDEFEKLLEAERVPVERFVRFRLSARADADDVLQEVYLAACQKFHQLKNKDAFKPWLISIARNKCNDYFRGKAEQYEIPIDEMTEGELADSRYGVSVVSTVRETLDSPGRYRQTAEHPCRNGQEQAAHGEAEIQKEISISQRGVERRIYDEKTARIYPRIQDRSKRQGPVLREMGGAHGLVPGP